MERLATIQLSQSLFDESLEQNIASVVPIQFSDGQENNLPELEYCMSMSNDGIATLRA
jgi:hypothetical protein